MILRLNNGSHIEILLWQQVLRHSLEAGEVRKSICMLPQIIRSAGRSALRSDILAVAVSRWRWEGHRNTRRLAGVRAGIDSGKCGGGLGGFPWRRKRGLAINTSNRFPIPWYWATRQQELLFQQIHNDTLPFSEQCHCESHNALRSSAASAEAWYKRPPGGKEMHSFNPSSCLGRPSRVDS